MRVPKYQPFNYKQKNQICETLDTYLWSCIQGYIEMTDHIKLSIGTAQFCSLLCSLLRQYKDCWCYVGAQLLEVDTISSLAFWPLIAADRLIVGLLWSIALILSKMQDQKSLMLRWHSFKYIVMMLWTGCLPRKSANSSIMDECHCTAPWLSKMQGPKLLTLQWR